VPSGYETRLAQHDPAASARRVGGIFLGAAYGSAYVSALSYPSRIGALYVPVAGPWLTLKQVESTSGKVLLAANGALQGTGAILLIGGIAGAGLRVVRLPGEEAQVRLFPDLARSRVGVSLSGSF
jgi:hypothetical protein